MKKKKKIVIIGGGFAGLQMARKITDKYDMKYTDKHNSIILFIYIVISVSLFLVEALYCQGKL